MWIVPVTVVRVIDGDTLVVDADLGWFLTLRMHVRVAHINAPETETAEGKKARDYARGLLPVGTALTLVSEKLDKYGRSLGALSLAEGEPAFPHGGLDLAGEMLAAGLAVPYEGGARG